MPQPLERTQIDYNIQEEIDERKRLIENMRVIRSYNISTRYRYETSPIEDYDHEESRANGFNSF